jgi:hypothetical protein
MAIRYNGANIPGKACSDSYDWTYESVTDLSLILGKPKEALNYAGGIPIYIKEIGRERDEGYPGFQLQ